MEWDNNSRASETTQTKTTLSSSRSVDEKGKRVNRKKLLYKRLKFKFQDVTECAEWLFSYHHHTQGGRYGLRRDTFQWFAQVTSVTSSYNGAKANALAWPPEQERVSPWGLWDLTYKSFQKINVVITETDEWSFHGFLKNICCEGFLGEVLESLGPCAFPSFSQVESTWVTELKYKKAPVLELESMNWNSGFSTYSLC